MTNRDLVKMMLLKSLNDMPIKFFARDIISGRADKVGDTFIAKFMGRNTGFKVVEHHKDFFFGVFQKNE